MINRIKAHLTLSDVLWYSPKQDQTKTAMKGHLGNPTNDQRAAQMLEAPPLVIPNDTPELTSEP
jgi:hypothetical protein